MRVAIGVAIAIVVSALPRAARADVALQLVLAPGVTWTRDMPTLTSDSVTTSAREVPKAGLPMRGGLASIGGYLDT